MGMMDVYFYIGEARDDAPVYHVLVRLETFVRMHEDPNIHIVNVHKMNGAFENDELPPAAPIFFMDIAHCSACLNEIRNFTYHPSYCIHCGRRILYEDS